MAACMPQEEPSAAGERLRGPRAPPLRVEVQRRTNIRDRWAQPSITGLPVSRERR